MIINQETRVADAIRAVLPTCPDTFIDDYLNIYGASVDEITKMAKFTLEKPYGQNHILIDSGDFGLSFAQLQPGQNSSTHFHNIRKEFFCVKTGVLTLTKGEQVYEIGTGDINHSTPGEPHSIANNGSTILAVLEIFSPALLSDKVRVTDRYDRKLGKVLYTE